MVDSYKVVTISNREPSEWYYTYPKQFLKSLNGYEPLILGQQPGEFTGLSDKPRILYHAIKDGLIKEDIIIFVDAWDTVFLQSPEHALDDFSLLKTPILIGAEKNCFPSNFKKEFDRLPHTSSYRYLNSGVIIGFTEAILTVLEAMDAPNLPVDYHDSRKGINYHFNDQAYFMDMYLRQPVDMRLDYNCMIAQNMQNVEEHELDFSGMLMKNNETGFYPSIAHLNGSSKDKWGRAAILKHLNLL